jgi:hypothetical protein
MTLREYLDFKKKFEAEAVKQLTKNQDLIDAGEKDKNKYYQKYMTRKHISSGDIQPHSIKDLKEEIEEMERDTDRFKNCPDFNIGIEATAYNEFESASIDEIYIQAEWLYPADYEKFRKAWKTELRHKIGKLLMPKNKKYPVLVECKSLQMFEEGELTWKGMQKMTYGTCDT